VFRLTEWNITGSILSGTMAMMVIQCCGKVINSLYFILFLAAFQEGWKYHSSSQCGGDELYSQMILYYYSVKRNKWFYIDLFHNYFFMSILYIYICNFNLYVTFAAHTVTALIKEKDEEIRYQFSLLASLIHH
jgi:hypothetical protein